MRLLRKILIIPTIAILFADPPDWVDNPGGYEFSATISGGIVLNINGEQMGGNGDMFAAFDDDGNVRGVGVMLSPQFGPYQDTPVFEVQLRSNDVGDILHFQYYDASEDAILEICQTYEFVINGILGNVMAPVEFNIGSFCMSFANVSSTGIDINYESNTEIAGFQFDITGVTLTSASGGDAEENGFSIEFSSTVLGFNLSGITIPAGSGTLLSLEFEQLSGYNTLDVNNVVISGPGGFSIPSSGPGSIEIEPFTFIQSTLQAFYFFNLVIINDIEVESNDWVGAFNGDVCVGARQWDTSQCGSGICDVPVLGDDGSDYTNGYMVTGDLPTFKIYDGSENLYYDAIPSDEHLWFSQGQYSVEILSANIPGCTDSNDCNYDSSATEDDGSCSGEQFDECGICGGDNVNCSDPTSECTCLGCTEDGACNYSTFATINNGSCYYAEENYDCASSCCTNDPDTGSAMDISSICSDGAIIVDCAGECGGGTVIDECEVCGGDNSSCLDCAGVPNGEAVYDNCGEECITADPSADCSAYCDADSSNDCVQDCAGNWGGGQADDECEVCGGDNSSCLDCAGVPNGEAVYDNCGEECITADPSADCSAYCDADSSNDCVQDCAGNWGGAALDDECGTCGGTVEDESGCGCDGDEVMDCAGECGGAAVGDECDVCNGIDDYVSGTCNDCAGVPNGENVEDNCGTCDSDSSIDCIQDCAGTWGGVAIDDECGVCGGDNSSCTDCNGDINGTAYTDLNYGQNSCTINECVGGSTLFIACTQDCSGSWGGSAVDDACGVCGGDETTCLDCANVPNGTAVVDNCGTCDSNTTNNCVQDCAGQWGGSLIGTGVYECSNEDIDNEEGCIVDNELWYQIGNDECGVCGGDCFGDLGEECDNGLTDCEGDCVVAIDCEGNCGGTNTPTFQCENGNVVCNPADCNCVDCLGIPLYLLPNEFGINKIFPNPFNPVTHIQYGLTQFGLISIKIYDIQGRVVDQLMNEYQSPGHYSLNWNAGHHASGMYIVEMIMQLDNNEISRDLQKILYLK